MASQSKATINDLYLIPEKAELIDGGIVLMAPAEIDPGYASDETLFSLWLYVKRTGKGRAVGDDAAFRVNLPHRESFSPDAACVSRPASGMKFFKGAPDFAVEVRSAGDYGPKAEQDIAAKRADYFAAVTLTVWDVDLLSDEVVKVYRASDPANPVIYHRGGAAEAEPAVPGWTMPVADLFASDAPRSTV